MRTALPLTAVLLGGLLLPTSAVRSEPPPPVRDRVVVNPRYGLMDMYPCQPCHKNVEARPAVVPPRRPHGELKVSHMKGAEQCYGCHALDQVDQLRLFDGSTVPFAQTAVLCGQCHSARKKDWDLGIHGKQVGKWRGTRHRYTCADCHDPHAPKRKKVKAEPAPPRPAGAHPEDRS